MKMKYNIFKTSTALFFSALFLFPVVGFAADDGWNLLPTAGADNIDNKNLFFTTENFGQELKSSVAGHVIDIVRLQNISNQEVRSLSSGNNYLSFSYEGSSGLLGFSSGYIYSADDESGFLVDNSSEQAFMGYADPNAMANVYLGLDIARSISLSDDLELGLRAGVIYLEDIYDERDDGTVSLLFVMPLEISNSVTIAPKVHWSRSFTKDKTGSLEDQVKQENSNENIGSFYGGVSITFAY